MNLKQLIPLGIIGSALLLFTPKLNNNNNNSAGATGGIDKTRNVVVEQNGTQFQVEVPKDSSVKHGFTIGGTPTIDVYRADGTLQAVYTAKQKTWKDIEAEQKAQIQATGAPIKQQIKYNTTTPQGNVVTKTGNYVTYTDSKTGKIKMVTAGQYERDVANNKI